MILILDQFLLEMGLDAISSLESQSLNDRKAARKFKISSFDIKVLVNHGFRALGLNVEYAICQSDRQRLMICEVRLKSLTQHKSPSAASASPFRTPISRSTGLRGLSGVRYCIESAKLTEWRQASEIETRCLLFLCGAYGRSVDEWRASYFR